MRYSEQAPKRQHASGKVLNQSSRYQVASNPLSSHAALCTRASVLVVPGSTTKDRLSERVTYGLEITLR